MIKKIVYNDAYRPHTFEEISALLAPEVAATLDADKEYGVQWWSAPSPSRTRLRQFSTCAAS